MTTSRDPLLERRGSSINDVGARSVKKPDTEQKKFDYDCFKRNGKSIVFATLFFTGSVFSLGYTAIVGLPESFYVTQARNKRADGVYEGTQAKCPEIFDFHNGTHCTIVQDLCDENCSATFVNCSVYDPQVLNCGRVEPGVNGDFEKPWSDDLRYNNPVPYTSPLDRRWENCSKPDLDQYLALCGESSLAKWQSHLVLGGEIVAVFLSVLYIFSHNWKKSEEAHIEEGEKIDIKVLPRSEPKVTQVHASLFNTPEEPVRQEPVEPRKAVYCTIL